MYHSSIGSFCVEAGLFNDAEAAYKKAAELDPENASLLLRVRRGILPARPVVMEDYLDDKSEEMIARKSLKPSFAIGLMRKALELLQRK